MENQNKAIFSREAAWLLALAMLASATYHFAHPFFLSRDYLHLPGVGLAVTQWMLLGGCLLCAVRKKRLQITRGGVLLAVLSALLALCYALYANDMLRLMNLPVLCALTVQALFSYVDTSRAHPCPPPGCGRGCADSSPRWSVFSPFPCAPCASVQRCATDSAPGYGWGLSFLFRCWR